MNQANTAHTAKLTATGTTAASLRTNSASSATEEATPWMPDSLRNVQKESKKTNATTQTTQSTNSNSKLLETQQAQYNLELHMVLYLCMYNSTAPAEKVILRDPSVWICDSGATCHATWNCAAFNTLQPHKQLIAVGNGKYCFSEGLGNITLSVIENGHSNTLELSDVLYITEMETQLLSENRATAKGMQILKSGTECLFIKDDEVAFKANQSMAFGNLWIIRDSSPKVSNKQTLSNYSQPLATIPDLMTCTLKQDM
jgi:hypothetical protein